MQTEANNGSTRDLTVRRAKTEDIPFLAQIDLIATTPPFDTSMWDEYLAGIGTPTARFLEAMFVEGASTWGAVEDFIVLELAGTPAAACAVYDAVDAGAGAGAEQGMIDLSMLPLIAARLGWPDAALRRFQSRYVKDWQGLEVILKPQADAIVETVGVLPEFRGNGLGSRLMQESRKEALRRGHTSIGISAIHGNEPAARLYERYFEPYITYHASFFEDRFPGITKYRATLAANETSGKAPA